MLEVLDNNAIHRQSLGRIRFNLDSARNLDRDLRRLPLPRTDTVATHTVELLRLVSRFDEENLRAILNFATDAREPSGLLIQDCPLGEPLPPTPVSGGRAVKDNYVAENFSLLIASLLGHPAAFTNEKAGELIANLIPLPGRGHSVSNEGYSVPLDLHSDLVHLGPHTPAFVILACLRGDVRGEAITFHVDARDVLSLLDPEDVAVLRQPRFQIELPASFQRSEGNGRSLSDPMPVISGPSYAPQIAAEFNSCRPTDEHAARVLTALERACRAPGVATGINLQSGDVLLLRNRAALHGRSPFSPQFDSGKQRWLQRLYVMADLWAVRHAMTSTHLLEGAFL